LQQALGMLEDDKGPTHPDVAETLTLMAESHVPRSSRAC
jgi:hypothetical protein